MCILKRMQEFAANGTRVFGKASKRQYHFESDAVKSIKKEMMSGTSGRHTDIENRMNDMRKVDADVRRSFNKLILKTG